MTHLFNEVVKGDRCFYYTNEPENNENRLFRANFYEIYSRSFIVKKYIDHNSQPCNAIKVSIPLLWIKKIVTLNDILGKYIGLLPEIFRIIDYYL